MPSLSGQCASVPGHLWGEDIEPAEAVVGEDPPGQHRVGQGPLAQQAGAVVVPGQQGAGTAAHTGKEQRRPVIIQPSGGHPDLLASSPGRPHVPDR